MSKRKRSWMLAAAALTMAASFDIMEITAIASGSTAGRTELSLGVSQMAPEAVSFEVPLYLTMCVQKKTERTRLLCRVSLIPSGILTGISPWR